MTENPKTGFIGAGNMATALIKGLIQSGVYEQDHLFVSDKEEGALKSISTQFDLKNYPSNSELVRECSIVVLSVKPQNIREVLEATLFTTPGSTTTALTHVVHTHRADGTEVVYIDGVANLSSTRTGGMSMWDATYRVVVANEGTNDRAWLGELHLIAVYDRALDLGEVQQNFTAGP